LCNFRTARDIITEIRPSIVINAAALTDVDKCEDGVDDAFGVNAHAVRNLACLCGELGSVLVHISTDFVFGGEKRVPYLEEDAPNPLSVYGVSKLAGEYFVRNTAPAHFIVRTSGLYGTGGIHNGHRNFVETMIRLARENARIRVVVDQVLAPTYTKDLVEVINSLIKTEAYGVYHVTNSGQCSRYEFAARIFRRMGICPDFGPTTSAEFGARARRPAYSVLAQDKLAGLGFRRPRGWAEALDAYLDERGHTGMTRSPRDDAKPHIKACRLFT
jgi:dTDP-4-dehydrorhamnose reductase